MANLSFNFNKINRTFFNVTLKDGRKLQVKMPKKSTFGKVSALQAMQDDENATAEDVMDTFAGILAECLSNNLSGERVTAEEIAEDYDIEEMKGFISEYYEKFVGSIQQNPN